MNRLGDLNLQIAIEPDLGGVEGGEGGVDLQSVAEDVAAVGDQDVVALWLLGQIELFGQVLVLE